ncbi:hypothetical protein [Thaumasiovibrio sp. DFM-14]|uniref:hypothetical protein n=1 Tax=Thaumasiovibrio sp. DFM-14 TaxID=3384792 RepID=UPI0039A3C3F2
MKALLISMLFLISLPSFASPGQMHYAKAIQVEVREEPSESAKVKFVIAAGRKLVEFDRKGKFVWVGVDKSGGLEGWVLMEHVGSTDPDGLKY